jgi:hypothetical protein
MKPNQPPAAPKPMTPAEHRKQQRKEFDERLEAEKRGRRP